MLPQNVVHLITFIGIFFSVLFHVFVKEPSHAQEWELKQIDVIESKKQPTAATERSHPVTVKGERNLRIWSDWLRSVSFWKICLIYVMSRLYVNVTQVYTPLYLQETLLLAKVSQERRISATLSRAAIPLSVTLPLCHSSLTLPVLYLPC